jgi:hypothetical protein
MSVSVCAIVAEFKYVCACAVCACACACVCACVDVREYESTVHYCLAIF